MRNLIAGSLVAAALTIGVAAVPAAAADADATVHQIYEAAQSGHLDQAQQMISQVLRDHPDSSKAHFIQAELYAREGNPGLARSELARAEQLDPGLTKESPRAVEELRAQLGLIHRSGGSSVGVARSQPTVPWVPIVVLVLVVGVFWMLFRRRRSAVYPASGVGPGSYGPGSYATPGYGPGPGPGYGPGGGIGSNIAGGLAGGLAAGAGIVAGEELAHHFLDGNGRPVAAPPSDDGSWNANPNNDMGGTDFGVNDPGSWDDGGGGGGGGGDDWT